MIPPPMRAAITVAVAAPGVAVVAQCCLGWATAGQLPGTWVSWAAAYFAVVALALMAVNRIGRPLMWVLAALLGTAVGLPWLGEAIRGNGNSSALWALSAGLAVAAGTAAASAIGRPRVLQLVTALATAFVLLSLLSGLIAWFGGSTRASYTINERDALGLWQLRGIAGHPNGLAMVAVVALAAQMVWLLEQWPKLHKGPRALALAGGPIATAITIFWTQSRTGWGAALLVLAVVLIPQAWDRFGLISGALALASAAAVVLPPMVSRLESSFNGRWVAWKVSIDSVLGSPLLGPGPALFRGANWPVDGVGAQWHPNHAHNQLIQSAVMLGLLGLLIAVAAGVLSFGFSYAGRELDGRLGLAVCCGIAVFAGVESVLGVGAGADTYLPILLAAPLVGRAAAGVGRRVILPEEPRARIPPVAARPARIPALRPA